MLLLLIEWKHWCRARNKLSAIPIDRLSSNQSFYSSNVELIRKRGNDETEYVVLREVDVHSEDKETGLFKA